jgi:hypothetical protein
MGRAKDIVREIAEVKVSILAKRYHSILQEMCHILLLKCTTCYYIEKTIAFYLLVTAKSA